MDLLYTLINNKDKKNTPNVLHQTGRFIVKYAAEKIYNIKNPEIEIINKKPKYKFSEIQFSISHSHDIVCVCFDKNSVGFDIEKILPRDYKAISERMKFQLKEDTLNEFYKIWTTYEAEYKLQNTAKSKYSEIFLDKYIISVVSNKTTDIKNNLNYIKINID